MKLKKSFSSLALVASVALLSQPTTTTATPLSVEWIRQIGTSEDDYSRSVAIDGSGSVYISGHTRGNLEGINAGYFDAYISKFDSSGNQLWTRQIGTVNWDKSFSVAVDGSGNAYISGFSGGSLEGTNAGSYDAYLSKFNSNGNQLWTQQIGTSNADYCRSVAVDDSGNVYISGYTEGSLEGTNAGYFDAYLSKFDSSGNQLWIQQIGTSYHDFSFSVAIDGSGNAYISGRTLGSLAGDYEDAYLSKFDSSGNQLWIQQIGTINWDGSYSVAVDSSGNVYISVATPAAVWREPTRVILTPTYRSSTAAATNSGSSRLEQAIGTLANSSGRQLR